MNLLPFVFVLLLLFSSISYTLLQSTLQNTEVRRAAGELFKEHSIGAYNEKMQEIYDHHHVSGDERPNKRERESGKIGIFSLIDADSKKQQLTETLLTRLIELLYQNQNFYQEALLNNPAAVTQLLDELKVALDNGRKEKVITTNPKSLAHAQLETLASQELYSKMLAEAETQNLLDYVISSRTGQQINLWNAQRKLLEAIFGDAETANEIVNYRRKAYNEIRNSDDKNSLRKKYTEDFERAYQTKLPYNFPKEEFNFNVTGTRPPS